MSSTGDDSRLADAAVAAEVVRAVVAGVDQFSADSREAALAVLSDHDLADPTAADWYPLESCLAALDAVAAVVGDRGTRALGERVPRAVGLVTVSPSAGTADSLAAPAGAADVPGALAALDDVYRAHHRGDVGGYAFRQIGDDDGRVECRTPYPCAFDRGVVEGAAAGAADSYVRLREVGVCRADGAPRCTYEVTW